MDEYLHTLVNKFNENKNNAVALGQKKYLLNKFEFLGIKTPLRKELLNAHLRKFGNPEKANIQNYVNCLWNLNEREFQYLAVNLTERIAKEFNKEDIMIIEYMIENKSWWDSVDSVIRLNKVYFEKFPDEINARTGKWINSDNFWYQRSALLFQLNFRDAMDEELMFDYILRVKDSTEFFVQKAIGWILRQYSKFCPEAVIEFVNNHELAALSKREALKHIKKQ
jgi:3-methyladenine DNA glycosylase AlkD